MDQQIGLDEKSKDGKSILKMVLENPDEFERLELLAVVYSTPPNNGQLSEGKIDM